MFLALYIQIILLCCGRPSKNVQIIRHRCVLTALSSPKRKAPPVGGALKCSFVAHRALCLSRPSRTGRRMSRTGVALVARSWRAWRGPESLLLLESSSNLVGDVHGAVDVLNVIELVELIDKTLNLLCIRN